MVYYYYPHQFHITMLIIIMHVKVAKIEIGSQQSNSVSVLSSHLTGIHSAIKMLHSRIKLIYKFLIDTKNNDIPTDHYLLRQIASVAHKLKTPSAQQQDSKNGDETFCSTSSSSNKMNLFRDEFLCEHNDAMLLLLLSMMTNGTHDLNNVVEKINIANERKEKAGGAVGAYRRTINVPL